MITSGSERMSPALAFTISIFLAFSTFVLVMTLRCFVPLITYSAGSSSVM